MVERGTFTTGMFVRAGNKPRRLGARHAHRGKGERKVGGDSAGGETFGAVEIFSENRASGLNGRMRSCVLWARFGQIAKNASTSSVVFRLR